MSTTIGSLNVKVSASSVGVAEEFAKTEKTLDRVRAAATRTNASFQQFGGSSGGGSKAGSMFQEVGRGLEDFSSVYQTGGLAMGIRAASNNISQFASLMSPMAGAVAGVSIALGTLLIPKVWEWVSSSKEGELATKRLEKSFSDFHKTLQDGEAIRKTALDASRFTDVGQVQQSSRALQDQKKEGRTQLDALLDQRAMLEKEQAKPIVYKVGSTAGEMIGQKGAFNDQQKARGEEIKKLTEEINKGLREQGRLAQQIAAVEKNRVRTEEIGAAKGAIAQHDEAVKQISEIAAERNRRMQEGLALERQMNAEINPRVAKEMELNRIYQERLKQIDKMPISQSEKQDLADKAWMAGTKELERSNLDKLNEQKQLLEMQRNRFQQARSITPVQAALTRGSSAEVSANLRNAAQQKVSPGEQAIVNAINKLNREIARISGKPVELVQGHF